MWNSSNSTVEQSGTKVPYITLVSSLTAVGVLTLSANILLLITLFRHKSKYLKHSTRLFLIYKSLGHAFQGLSLMARPHVTYKYCSLYGSYGRAAMGMVIGGMLLLSLDSFVTITKPFRHQFIMTPRVAKLLVFANAVFAGILVLIALLVPSHLHKPPGICTQNDSQVDPYVLLIMSLIAILLICVALGLQGYNIIILWRKSKSSPNTGLRHPHVSAPNAVDPIGIQPLNTHVKKKATRMERLQRLLTIWVVSIFVCWMPSCIIICWRAAMDVFLIEIPVLAWVQPFVTVLPLTDGVLQPCLAIALSEEIRSSFLNLFRCGRCAMTPTNNHAAGHGGDNPGNNAAGGNNNIHM